jgi:hypothetical protein
MDSKKAILLKILLNRYGKGSPQIALKYLPEELIKQVSLVSISSSNFTPLFDQSQKWLHKIHYSWLLPYLKKMPSEIHLAVISCLSKNQQSRLKNILNLSDTSPAPSLLARNYIYHCFSNNVKDLGDVLPPEYLPETPFTNLLSWEKKELIELIEFLGLHDLSEEMRHIVDKKILKNAYNCLTPKEQQYLKICMHIKEKVVSPSLGLDKWAGDKNKLKTVLQTRGLIRMSKALSGIHPDFVWHLAHALDTGRGQAMNKYYSKAAIPGITPALAQQIVNIMNFLKP